jgi:hypothetical protein
VKEGLARLKGEREQLQGQLKELDAAKAPHDVVREQAAKFVTSWTDIGQLIDDADLAEQRVILQHLVHSLVLTAADKEAKHGTYALRLFPEIGRITPDDGGNDRGPNPDAPRKGPGDRAVLTENDVVRQFGKEAPPVGFEPTTRRLTAGCSTAELQGITTLMIYGPGDGRARGRHCLLSWVHAGPMSHRRQHHRGDRGDRAATRFGTAAADLGRHFRGHLQYERHVPQQALGGADGRGVPCGCGRGHRSLHDARLGL